MAVYLAFAILGGFLVGLRFLLAWFGWGGPDKYGGHRLHTLQNALAAITLPLLGLAGFGLAGLAASVKGLAEPLPFFCGLVGGLALAVPIPLLEKLNTRPAIRLDRLLRQPAVVRETIPAHHGGRGLVAVEMPSGPIEVRAVTAAAELAPGARVTVHAVLDPDTIEVVPEVDFEQLWRKALPS
jgi:hypothetical protein